MALNLENIQQNTTCPDCGGTEMKLGYSYGDGSLHKKTTILGMPAYSQASNMVMVICKNCGLIAKTYATDVNKL